MRISEAFGQYGAKLKNSWSVSAENSEGELIVSLWKHMFKPPAGKTIRYVDKASRWSGHGNAEFRTRIEKAYRENQTVKVVIARTDDKAAVDRGDDASKLKNTFHARPDWIGRVSQWDGDNVEIEFVALLSG